MCSSSTFFRFLSSESASCSNSQGTQINTNHKKHIIKCFWLFIKGYKPPSSAAHLAKGHTSSAHIQWYSHTGTQSWNVWSFHGTEVKDCYLSKSEFSKLFFFLLIKFGIPAVIEITQSVTPEIFYKANWQSQNTSSQTVCPCLTHNQPNLSHFTSQLV